MGSVASFLSQFTQGLTGTLQQHHAEQKKLELKEQEDQLNTLQMAAQQAASTGDTRAYGMILRKIGDFTSTGSGKKGAAGKSNIMHQFADMLQQGVEEKQEVPNLPQSNFQPQMSFNQQGQPALTPKPPEVIAAQNEAMLTPKFELVRKPLFETSEERQAKELKLYESKRNIEADINERRDAAKAKTKLEEVRLRIKAQLEGIGLRNVAGYEKETNSLAYSYARQAGRATPSPMDFDAAADTIIGTAKAKEERVTEQVNKLKQDIKDAPVKLKLLQQRVDNALTLGQQRNAIAAGQLGLAGQKFDYQKQVGDSLKASMTEYRSLSTRLNQINNDIAQATKDGNERGRDEAIQEATQIKNRMGTIEAGMDTALQGTYTANEDPNRAVQPNVQVTPPPTQQAAPPKVAVGQQVQLKSGKNVTITKIYPDGSFDYK